MRWLPIFILFFLSDLPPVEKEKAFTGSTPAGSVTRAFLGISLADSIDFIRWKITFTKDQFQLLAQYGIGKPNTNGFIKGGTRRELSGTFQKTGPYLHLFNGGKKLGLVELNEDVLHLLDGQDGLLVGNAGWSYTLNSLHPGETGSTNLHTAYTAFKDSLVFEGRTPCKVPGIIPEGRPCYKIKWQVVLYAPDSNGPGKYRILGTPWRTTGGKHGNWKLQQVKNGMTLFQLSDEKGRAILYFLKPDDQLLLFTDSNGKLLVGDEDFSYTLNRRL